MFKEKSIFKFLIIFTAITSISLTPVFATENVKNNDKISVETQDNVLEGIWSRGEPTVDPIDPYEGYMTDSEGNITQLESSPLEQMTSRDWSSGYYIYSYVSFAPSSTSNDSYHYNVGSTQAYNATGNNATLSYTQSSSATSTWSVTNQIQVTANLKKAFLEKLTAAYSFSYTSSNTTSSGTSILYSITVPTGKTGVITAYLPGAYCSGTATYKEYYSDPMVGISYATGKTVTQTESGWAPVSSSSTSVLNFKGTVN